MHQNLNIPLSKADPLIAEILKQELARQQNQIELIASENFTSQAVMEATGSVLTNKYAEGYPHRRYYGGCEIVDQAESAAIERACKLFSCQFANVQPHSGSQANQGVFAAFLSPGDVILGMGMEAGGHLTHGAKVNLSGKWFQAAAYGVHPKTHLIDYDQVEKLALTHQPKLIIAGGSAYPRVIDFKRFREIADRVGAILMVDMAHFAGLVAGNAFPSPFPYAHVVTSTTHKTLRGPRGGLILTNDEQIAKKVNSAIFPGLQGGPLMHVIAAKAVAFGEALKPEFQTYCRQVVENAKTLAKTIQNHGLEIVSGGTDCHLILVDLTAYGITGKQAQETLELAGITCNKNGVPFDPLPPVQTSGIRLGSPAATSRGFSTTEFELLGNHIAEVLDAIRSETTETIVPKIRLEIEKLCKKFPLYPDL